MYALSALLSLAAVGAALPLATRDSNPGCNAASLSDFKWTIEGFEYNASYIFSTPAHQIDAGEVNFNITNPALTYPAVCHATSFQLQDYFFGDIIYTCTEGEDSSTTKTTFTYFASEDYLTWNQTWSCSDADPTYPSTFTYYGALNLTVDRYEFDYQNGNWSQGQTYSKQLITKKTATNPSVAPYKATAVA